MLPSAGSSPAGAASQAVVAPQLWILSPWKDLPLFVATPLLILPLGFWLRQHMSAEQIFAFVGAFGATGHHLPGMIRAYGDATLFARFKLRFIVAPIFLAVLCVAYSYQELRALTLVAYTWGIWHGLMQTYGFVRIYDVKVKSLAWLTAKLDYAMCAVWFIGPVLLSPERVRKIFDLLYGSGAPLLPGSPVAALIAATPWLMGAVTAGFLANLLVQWRRGHPASPVKLLLMATSFGFWWYTNVGIGSLLIGLAMFEVFHDVQYLSIVWMFNRRRTRESAPLGAFVRFVFGRSGAMVGVYVGLVLAYGWLAWLTDYVPGESLQSGLEGLFVASALLHFYFDGFIWKVREAPTRTSLGLEGGSALQPSGALPPWLVHGAKWALLVVPVAWLGAAQLGGTLPELARAGSLAAALPDDPISQYNLGTALEAQGNTSAAMAQYRAAIALDPDFANPRTNLGNLLSAQGDRDQAIAQYRAALRSQPDDALAHHNLGIALMNSGSVEEALSHMHEAVRLAPDFAQGFHDIGAILQHLGRIEEALPWYRAALRVKPDYPAAHRDLGNALMQLGQDEQATAHLSEAWRLENAARSAE